MDRLTTKQRSKNMSAVRSRGNKTTEIRFLKLLRTNKIFGWRRHPKGVKGSPDFVFPLRKVAVFIDGCFWHGCKKHYKEPGSNAGFWRDKIGRNMTRDIQVKKILSVEGWKVVRVWEHEIRKNSAAVLSKITKIIGRKKRPE